MKQNKLETLDAVWLELSDTKDGAVERVITKRGFDKTHTLGNVGHHSDKLISVGKQWQ